MVGDCVIQTIAREGRGVFGVRPQTTAALDALSAVEARFGTTGALQGALAVFSTVIATLGANTNSSAFDAGIALLAECSQQLASAKAALAAGAPPENAVVKIVEG